MTARAKHQSAYKVLAGEGEMLHAPPREGTREIVHGFVLPIAAGSASKS